MALTVLETTEQQLLPCQQAVEQGAGAGDGAGKAAAEKAAVMLKETDHGGADDDRPAADRDDIWNMIQAQKPAPPAAPRQAQKPYVVRRSSSLLTQKSLEICTESLGSETGSDGFSDGSSSATPDRSCPGSDDDERVGDEEEEQVAPWAAAAPPSRAFPPPLPSLARRKVESTMEMRQERQDGRLLVRVVPVASSTLFRAQRRGGRLLLSFADTAAPTSDELLDRTRANQPETEQQQQQQQQLADEEEDDEEDEVEVVDRGTVVEVKVSAQQSGPRRVLRSALVINKFVGAEPVTSCEIDDEDGGGAPAPQHPTRRSTGSTTTAVAALAAASALSATAAPTDNGEDAVPGATCGENKLLQMTAKRHSSKEELMKHMRRCSGQLSSSLFVWEGCIATST